jgi:hypothetical protein
MKQPAKERKVYDCFLYNGEVEALEIRLHELAEVVHRFVIVESGKTFRGGRKELSFDPLDPRIAPFAARIRYIVVSDMPRYGRAAQLEGWQRNAVLRGVPDAAEDDLVLVSDVDEIPSAAAVREIVRDDQNRIFGLQLASYQVSAANLESTAIRSVAAARAELGKVTPDDLRRDVRNRRIPARIISGADPPPHFTRSIASPTVITPPIIICPYVHAHEPAEIALKFGLDQPRGQRLEFFLWRDTDGLGPERAFQRCWDQFPDRDIVILHSDMAPMPDDTCNGWYDALLQYRSSLPRAGMLACNLFYPRSAPGDPQRVQCAGGTFRQGQIRHLRGPVQKWKNPTLKGVPAEVLRRVRAVDWVTFGGVLIRRELIRACGPFDDRYQWAYVMDVDYCFEARLRGFCLFQVPVALQHQAGRTTRALWEADPRLNANISRNFQFFHDKWRPFLAALPSIG